MLCYFVGFDCPNQHNISFSLFRKEYFSSFSDLLDKSIYCNSNQKLTESLRDDSCTCMVLNNYNYREFSHEHQLEQRKSQYNYSCSIIPNSLVPILKIQTPFNAPIEFKILYS